ncbi:nucleotidyltransferase family protein [Pelagibacterium montanilacus]|uniref:nucleotidyltransferase family protein n=1 Tax=Pelagibacterium montanilacus TaxID=2185280 RepID=UPI0013E074CE|nr:nucleotidyltransferase family protein [Pelagibacterium montanilacus]
MADAEGSSAVLLASGLSSRFSAGHKLAAALQDRPVGVWALDALAASRLDLVRVVCSPPTPFEVLAAAQDFGFEIVHNPDPEAGLGAAIAMAFSRPGLGARAFIALADMPFVRAEDYVRLQGALSAAPDRTIAVPTHERRRGHPVLFDRKHFAALGRLTGDRGAAGILREEGDAVLDVHVDNPGVLIDIDTQEALQAAQAFTLEGSE